MRIVEYEVFEERDITFTLSVNIWYNRNGLIGGVELIYLDYAATTPVRSEVVHTITSALQQTYGNPSSLYRIGKEANRQLEKARQQVAQSLGVKAGNIFFTSGATESNNWAIRSQAMQSALQFGKRHLVCSAIEHPSVLEICRTLEQEGYSVTYVTPNEVGDITIEAYEEATTANTSGWIMMAVNNEVGSRLPVEALSQRAKERGLWCHVDAVQAVGKVAISYEHVTSWALSGHKLYAPKGIGVLVYQGELPLQPFIVGGGQEKGKRSGTQNVPYILGMATAIQSMVDTQSSYTHHCQQLSDYLYAQLDVLGIRYQRNGGQNVQPHIHSLWFDGTLASQLLIQMDLANIAISAGSACSAGSVVDSHVLQAYYPHTPQRWRESVRVSFGIDTTLSHIDAFMTQLKQLQERKDTLWHLQNKQH